MMKLKRSLIIILVCLTMALIGGCQSSDTIDTAAEVRVAESPIPTEEPKPQVYEATIMAVGDDLLHSSVYQPFLQADGTYNFDTIFENLHDQIQGADIAAINQETIMIDDRSQISGYPTFGSPIEISDAIAKAGFNVVTHATNHAYDKGERGIRDTLSVWYNYFPGMTVLGIHESAEQADEICVVNVNNIKMALLNYTYGLNGFTLPEGKEYLVDTMYDQDKIQHDLERAEQAADVTVVFMHAGEEYHHTPSQYQKSFVNFMTDYGADIIIGAHPHYIQPYERFTTDLGNTSVVFYSLGNFVSGQHTVDRLLGGMANVTVRKTVDGGNTTVEVPEFSMSALITHQNGIHTTVYRLHDYNDIWLHQHRRYGTMVGFTIDSMWKRYDDIINGRLY